jgi:hypothetical protein
LFFWAFDCLTPERLSSVASREVCPNRREVEFERIMSLVVSLLIGISALELLGPSATLGDSAYGDGRIALRREARRGFPGSEDIVGS